MNVSAEMFFKTKHRCPNCNKEFFHLHIKSSYIITERQDSDFCSYYKDVNPIFYDIFVCDFCGYSYTKETDDLLSEEEKNRIKLYLSRVDKNDQYGGVRTLEQAINAYILAINCQELRRIKDSIKGSLYLRLAWLYRYQSNEDKEKECLQRTLELYKSYYEKESTGDLKNELHLTYLLGDLCARLGYMNEAVQWFYMITKNQKNNAYPVYVQMARARWQALRQGLNKD